MSVEIQIRKGSYRNEIIRNTRFVMLKDYVQGAKGGFVTVDGTARFGQDKVRVRVERSDYEVVSGNASELIAAQNSAHREQAEEELAAEPESSETDEEIAARIKNRFEILHGMTSATAGGHINAMIVSGAPGVGKSFGVERELEKWSFQDQLAGRTPKYEIIKGAMTPIGLYQVLYTHQDSGHVLVFDDCDSILQDDLSLNLLKAALDTNKTRRICWHADSKLLAREGIPSSFNFRGAVIFISNMNFDSTRKNTRTSHLEALKTRCHYLNLTIHTTREKLIRINTLLREGMLDDRDLSTEEVDTLQKFITDNAAQLQDLSLRMVIKIVDLFKAFPTKWQSVAQQTCFKHV